MAKKEKYKSQTTLMVSLAAFVVVIAGAMASVSILTPILISLFVGIICVQPIVWLHDKGLNHTLAVFIVLTLVIGIFTGIGALLGNSINSFAQDAPRYGQKLGDIVDGIIYSLNNRGLNLSAEKWDGAIEPGKILNYTASILAELGNLMSNALLILFTVMFLLLERASLRLKAEVIAQSYNNNLKVFTSILEGIRSYLGLKTIISLITGVFIWLWLLLIGVEYAILWAVIAFLMNYIPNFGSIIAGVPAVLFALVQLGLGGAGWTVLGYMIVNMVIGNIVEPRMMGREMGLSTLIVFLSLVFWGFILGTIGMFLAVPLTMTFKIILYQQPKTMWLAILLGSEDEAKAIAEESVNDSSANT